MILCFIQISTEQIIMYFERMQRMVFFYKLLINSKKHFLGIYYKMKSRSGSR